MNIRLLTETDCLSWKTLRLEALKNVPEAFGSSYEEESLWADERFQMTLQQNYIFGAFIDTELVASSAFFTLNNIKTKHKGVIWGVYVKPNYRKIGIAATLLQTLIQHAKQHVIQLHLSVTAHNLAAIKFYEKFGFKIYGTEPNALKIDNVFFDEHLMVLL
jgi:ribosomal protein S18 acetylase RimI-like enzyme